MAVKLFLIVCFFLTISGDQQEPQVNTTMTGYPILCDAMGNFYSHRRDDTGDTYHTICDNATHLYIDLNGYAPRCIYAECKISNRLKNLVTGILPSIYMVHETLKNLESNTRGLLPSPLMIYSQVDGLKSAIHKSENAVI